LSAKDHTGSAGDHTGRGVEPRATGVTAGYGGDPVIRGITVRVEPGQVVSLVGANGSGKSTLLKSLVGVVRVSAGTVTVGDVAVTNRPPEEVARAGVGYVPQVDDVFAPLTVRENLEMGGYLLRPKEVKPRIDHVVTVFPRLATMLARPAGKLSGGERKMLAMGRVLMLEPSVFLLDEPTAKPRPGRRPLPARGTRPQPRPGRRLSPDRGAARPRCPGHLRSHLRPGRRRGPHGRHPGRIGHHPGLRRIIPRRHRDALIPGGRHL
jgi:ABC-type lipoprotein export system ATPase subunit